MYFLRMNLSTIPATSIRAIEWLADQVSEPLRGPVLSVKKPATSVNRIRGSRFLLEFTAQKFTRSNNLSLTVGRLFVSQASCEFLILRNCGMKGGITDASEESSGQESGSCKKGSCEKGRKEGACKEDR